MLDYDPSPAYFNGCQMCVLSGRRKVADERAGANMRLMICERTPAMVFLSVPVVALLVLSPVRSSSQMRQSLFDVVTHEVITDDEAGVVTKSLDTSAEPIADLADWSYTANPMSPIGKTNFQRRLLSTTQPGSHPTPAGPNPRVPWITQPASAGNNNFASVSIPAVQSPLAPLSTQPSTSLAATDFAANPGTTLGNPQRYATPIVNTTNNGPTTVVVPTALVPMLASPPIIGGTKSFAFQPVKSQWQDRAKRKLGLGLDAANN